MIGAAMWLEKRVRENATPNAALSTGMASMAMASQKSLSFRAEGPFAQRPIPQKQVPNLLDCRQKLVCGVSGLPLIGNDKRKGVLSPRLPIRRGQHQDRVSRLPAWRVIWSENGHVCAIKHGFGNQSPHQTLPVSGRVVAAFVAWAARKRGREGKKKWA
jgi:hypothetical protein